MVKYYKFSPQVQLETALERVSALEEEAKPHKTEEVTLVIIYWSQQFYNEIFNNLSSAYFQVGCQFAYIDEGEEEIKETESRER